MGTKEALNIGKKIFLRMPKEYQQSNAKNKILYALLNMFIRCNDQENAENLFLRLNRDVMSYGAMMKMYNENNKPEKTMSLVEQMTREKIKPDAIIYLMMINACAQLGDLSLCQSTMAKVPKNVLTERSIQNALIDMWVSSFAEKLNRMWNLIELGEIRFNRAGQRDFRANFEARHHLVLCHE